ncbi:MAG: VanZ family protein [Lachnospiraceae bacterium]|nr:VanZ family protein [Lachnospiraceae bacterium]
MSSGKHDGLKKFIGIVLFIIYLIAMCYILFFMDWRSRNSGGALKYNAVPFREIRRYIGLIWSMPAIALMNLLGNIMIFIPFGALVTFFCREKRCVVLNVTLIGFVFSCGVEITQLFTRVGSCDVDDIILNTIGGFIGSLIYYIHYHWRKKR